MAQATKLIDLPGSSHARPKSGGEAQPPPTERSEGPRRLIRPQLPEHLAAPAPTPRRLRGPAPLAAHESPQTVGGGMNAGAMHAEALYFQKQMQAHTPMIFVLEDGEQVEGTIEWFDADSIKVRNHTRILIFKRSIKYLHKANADGTL